MAEIGTPTYPAEIEFFSKLAPEKREAFGKWMAELDDAHAAIDSPYGVGSLWQTTGANCWFDYFENEFSPGDALAEDMSYAEE